MFIKLAERGQKVVCSGFVYVSMTPEILHELQSYVEHYETEVSGCGLVERVVHKDKEGKYESTEFKITDVFLPAEQDNSGASTEIDTDVLHTFMHELLAKNVDTSKVKLHWHSHADMTVFHSGTDTDNYETLNNGDFLVSLVLNKSKDVLASVHLYKEVCIDIIGVPVYVGMNIENTEMVKKIKENTAKLDKYIASKPISTYTGGYDWKSKKQEQWWEREYWDKKLGKWMTKKENVESIIEEDDMLESEIAEFETCPAQNCTNCDKVVECTEYYQDTYNWAGGKAGYYGD